MNQNKKKMIAPILVTVILALYYVVYFGFLIAVLEGGWNYAFGLFPVLFTAVLVKVCIERIKEIKKGEENDLSQY